MLQQLCGGGLSCSTHAKARHHRSDCRAFNCPSWNRTATLCALCFPLGLLEKRRSTLGERPLVRHEWQLLHIRRIEQSLQPTEVWAVLREALQSLTRF